MNSRKSKIRGSQTLNQYNLERELNQLNTILKEKLPFEKYQEYFNYLKQKITIYEEIKEHDKNIAQIKTEIHELEKQQNFVNNLDDQIKQKQNMLNDEKYKILTKKHELIQIEGSCQNTK